MGSSFSKIMTVVRVTFHGPEVFAAFFQWCISIHKTSVSSVLTTTCFPHEWYSETILPLLYLHLQHTGSHFGINDYSIQQKSGLCCSGYPKIRLEILPIFHLMWKKCRAKLFHFYFYVVYLLWREQFYNNQTHHSSIHICCTNVFHITYTYWKTL